MERHINWAWRWVWHRQVMSVLLQRYISPQTACVFHKNSIVFKTITNDIGTRKTVYMTPHKRVKWFGRTSYFTFLLCQNFCWQRKEYYVSLQQELNDYIKKNGLKKSFVADELGMNGSKLSNFLHGKLLVTDEVKTKVRRYLDQKK